MSKLFDRNLCDIAYCLKTLNDFRNFVCVSRRCGKNAFSLCNNTLNLKVSFKDSLIKVPTPIIWCSFSEIQEFAATNILLQQQPIINLTIYSSEKLTNVSALQSVGKFVFDVNLKTKQPQILNVLSHFKNLKNVTIDSTSFSLVQKTLQTLPSLEQLFVNCEINAGCITELKKIEDDPLKYYRGVINVVGVNDSEVFESLFKLEGIKNGRFCVFIDCDLNSSQFMIATSNGALFSSNQIKKGICISSGMSKSAVVSDAINNYLISEIEVIEDTVEADLSDLQVETIKLKGGLIPMILSDSVKRIECILEDSTKEQEETKGSFEYDCKFYNKLTFNCPVEFKKKATFFNDVVFKKSAKFCGNATFNGSVVFFNEAEFKSPATFGAESKFKSNVVFGESVKGNEMIFEEKCEYWVKPEVKHPQYVRYMPDEMFVQRIDDRSLIEIRVSNERKKEKKEEKTEKRTWWGGLVEEVEKPKKRKVIKGEWDFMNEEIDENESVSSDEETTTQRKIGWEKKKMEEVLLKKEINITRNLRQINGNDMSAYVNIKELIIESKKEWNSLSIIVPSGITYLEINGKIGLDGITAVPNEPFNVHPIELRLCQCVIPNNLPKTIKYLSLKQCSGDISFLQNLPLQKLLIQTFPKLTLISLPSTLQELELVGIPTLTTVEGCVNLKSLKINMCIKLSQIPLPMSLDFVDLATCPQVIKMFGSCKLNPSFLKLNNKVISE